MRRRRLRQSPRRAGRSSQPAPQARPRSAVCRPPPLTALSSSRAGDCQRRHAAPGRLGVGGARRARSDVRLVVHPVFKVERDTTGRLMPFTARAAGDGLREIIHIHMERVDEEARRAEIVAAVERYWRTCAFASPTGAPCGRASRSRCAIARRSAALAGGAIVEAIAFWNGCSPTTSPPRTARMSSPQRRGARAGQRDRPIMRAHEMRELRRGGRPVVSRRKSALPGGRGSSSLSRAAPRVHRRVYMDPSGVSTPTASSPASPHHRASHPTAYTRSTRSISICAAVDAVSNARA